MMPLIMTAAGVALLLLAVYFLFCAHLVNKFLRRKPHDPERFVRSLKGTPMECYAEIILRDREWFAKQDREDVFIESYDQLSLHGQYLTHKDPRGTLLLVHGFQSSGENDFSCVLQYYYELGFNLLIIDQRGSLQSQGDYLTMGVRERWDVRSWCIWLLQRMGEQHRVVLDGISMGGATVLMAAGLDLPPNVRGIISDCPFTSPRDIFEHVMTSSIKLPTFLLCGADICCRIMAGFSIDGASTVEAIRDNRLPLLLIHGRSDDFVPCWMTEKCAAAAVNCEKDVVLVEEAGHGLSFLVDRDRVYAALVKFLDKLCPKTMNKAVEQVIQRIATPDDLNNLWQYNVNSHPGDDRWARWREEYIGYNQTGAARTYAVVVDGVPVGEGTLLFDPGCSAIEGRTILADGASVVNLNALRIRKPWEGRGYISAMVRLMEQHARQAGFSRITIGVDACEARNRAIYAHWGYTHLLFTEEDDGELVLYYEKLL